MSVTLPRRFLFDLSLCVGRITVKNVCMYLFILLPARRRPQGLVVIGVCLSVRTASAQVCVPLGHSSYCSLYFTYEFSTDIHACITYIPHTINNYNLSGTDRKSPRSSNNCRNRHGRSKSKFSTNFDEMFFDGWDM